MISNLDGDMTITGRDLNWTAAYDPEQTMGPTSFEAFGSPLLNSIRCSFGDLDESLALTNNKRLFRKGTVAVVSARGRLPFGAGVSFTHTHRYAEHSMRAVTDIRVPPQTRLSGDLAIDSIALPGSFRQWRQLNDDGSLSDWADLDHDGVAWDHHPLAILLQREDGLVLEIGAGFDLWRWPAGVIPNSPTACFSLCRTEQGVLFNRKVTVVGEEEVFLVPRDFRFTWYLAWGQSSSTQTPSGQQIPAPWKTNCDLDTSALRKALQTATNPTVVLDLAEIDWPKPLLHSGVPTPCFCSRGVTKRLRRIVRQIIDVLPPDIPISFAGLSPSKCSTGRHTERRNATDHWDLTGILEFAVWARQKLGAERVLTNSSPCLGLPSLDHLFALSDHDADTIEYEWTPPEGVE